MVDIFLLKILWGCPRSQHFTLLKFKKNLAKFGKYTKFGTNINLSSRLIYQLFL